MPSEPQEQPADSDATVEYVRQAVAAHPQTPRPASTWGAVVAYYRGRILLTLATTGIGVVGFVVLANVEGTNVAVWLLQWIALLFALFMALHFAYSGLELARMTRVGFVATADVVDVRLVTDEDGEPRADGHRIVHHPRLGDFRDEFAIGGSWIDSITMGSVMEVLVTPDEPTAYLSLGVRHR